MNDFAHALKPLGGVEAFYEWWYACQYLTTYMSRTDKDMRFTSPLPSDIITPMNDTDRIYRSEVEQRTAALRAQNICPSCYHFATGSVFPHAAEQTYYEDERVSCQLESYPRGIAHTIIIARDHYADIADMPVALGQYMIAVTHSVVNAIKRVTGAEKVYLVTMCSGALSHLHWQLIPRLPGEMIGGRVFASPRGVLTNYHLLRDRLAQETRSNAT